jgi:hypothetical protein
MFILNGKPLPLNVPFEANGTLFPANWLSLSTSEEREAQGISEVPDPPKFDHRFYTGFTASGTLIPIDHATLLPVWTEETQRTANYLLGPTDWTVVREIDNGTPVPSGIKTWRQDIRNFCETKVNSINATSTTDELAVYINGQEYSYWPTLSSL